MDASAILNTGLKNSNSSPLHRGDQAGKVPLKKGTHLIKYSEKK